MSSEELLKKIQLLVPNLESSQHKGSNGRIGIFGGSMESTGAPYFSAMAAIKIGIDMVYVFCSFDAGPIIKTYSPDLVVHPILDLGNALELILPLLAKIHCAVIGPGLGRNSSVLNTIKCVIFECNERKIPLVIDADGLFILLTTPDLLKSYSAPVILTPNKMEFKKLACSMGYPKTEVLEIAKKLKCVILVKGEVDVIVNGRRDTANPTSTECNEQGTMRRCIGQGDILAGATGAFLAWQKMFCCNCDELGFGIAAFAAATLTRRCCKLTYEQYRRSMTASNAIEFIQKSFESLFNGPFDKQSPSPNSTNRLSGSTDLSLGKMIFPCDDFFEMEAYGAFLPPPPSPRTTSRKSDSSVRPTTSVTPLESKRQKQPKL